MKAAPAFAASDGVAPAGPVLACLSLAVLLSSLGTSIANVGLPTLALAFGASVQQVQWVVLAYLLAITTLVVGAGRLGDLAGPRRVLLAGIGLFTTASVLCGVAPTLGLLIAARAAQGIGAAVMMALAMALAGQAVPKAKAGSAMGLLGAMSAVGTALGPALGGVLIAGFGWRAIFLAGVPLGVLAFVLALRNLPGDRRAPIVARFDHLGTLLLALTLAAYALAMTLGRLGLLLVAAAGAGLFLLSQARAASPLIHLPALRAVALRAGLAMSALVATVMMATLVAGPFYLARAFGFDAALVGLAMAAGPVAAALSGVPAGRLTDRYGARRSIVAGLIGMGGGTLALAVMPLGFGLAGYLAPMVAITVGYALFQAANNSAVMADAAPDQRGVVSGLLNLARNVGLVTGASVMGTVFARGAGAADIMSAHPAAVAAGMHATFTLATVLVGAALAIARTGK